MPCDVWKQFARTEETSRNEYRYFAFNKETCGVSETRRKALMKEHSAKMSQASNDKWSHKTHCPICSKEPNENFFNVDLWNRGE